MAVLDMARAMRLSGLEDGSLQLAASSSSFCLRLALLISAAAEIDQQKW